MYHVPIESIRLRFVSPPLPLSQSDRWQEDNWRCSTTRAVVRHEDGCRPRVYVFNVKVCVETLVLTPLSLSQATVKTF